MFTLSELKEAVVKTVEEKPETAIKIAWGVGITATLVLTQIDIWKLNRRVTKLAKYSYACSVNEEQHFCNALGRIDYICEQLNLSKEAMDAAGSAAAQANWARIGGTDELADILVEALNSKPI